MLSNDQALARLADALDSARSLGADAADAVYFGDLSSSVSVRLGDLEDIERSESEEIGLRVFFGAKSASVSTSDLSSEAIAAMAERAVAMAREAPEDRFGGLAPADRLMSGAIPELDIDDDADVPMERLRERAVACEEAARAVPGVTNSQGASASAGRARYALATSHGFSRSYTGSSYGVSAAVIAGTGAAMQRDSAHHGARHEDDLEAAETVGRRAADRAVARLNPLKLSTGSMTVFFDPRVGGSLLGHLLGAVNGAAIARKTSFLLDALGSQVFAPGVGIIDDPLRTRGLRSRPFDGEGLPARRTELVKDGVLQTWLLDSAAARQLGLEPTGHAQRGTSGPPGVGSSNLYMAPGPLSPAELMADVKRGVLVTELIGQGVNGVTGDYSRGAAGFLIEDGKITGPVAEITVAGNLKQMFRAAVPASDLEFRHGTNTPTIRIDGMTVAGA
jgi:PmbA protein